MSNGWILFHTSTYWDWFTTQDFLTAHEADIAKFYGYPDTFIPQLTKDFGYTVPLPAGQTKWALYLDPNSHGGATGTPTGAVGVTIAADSVLTSDPSGTLPGFWFYLLSLHETINDYTGYVTGHWPWANGSPLWQGGSQFPNFVDIVVLREVGQTQASQIQANRMLSAPSVKVLYDLYQQYGWGIYQFLFKSLKAANINFFNYSEPMITGIIVYVLGVYSGRSLLSDFANAGLTLSSDTITQAGTLLPNLTPPLNMDLTAIGVGAAIVGALALYFLW
jgi:hypothetical protein